MDLTRRIEIVSRNTVEIITYNELEKVLAEKDRVRAYLGFEPSGLFHIGWLIWAYKVRDLIEAGVEFYLLAATWHAWINDKLGGDLELIKRAAEHVIDVLEAIGISRTSYKLVYAEDLISDPSYWGLVIKISKNNTLARIRRALTIMGRKAEEAEIDASKLIYPAMQVADIFYLDVDIALGGTDQRKAHMLARDTAEKLGFKKVVALHTPLLTSLQGIGRHDTSSISEDIHAVEFKMSKSKPETAIFVYDPPEVIEKKIMKAYCPPKEVKYNPIIEINKYILFVQPDFSLTVERPSKYGGTITIENYPELEKIYREGKLHPLDLKKATAKSLSSLLEPVRKYFTSSRQKMKILEELGLRVTR